MVSNCSSSSNNNSINSSGLGFSSIRKCRCPPQQQQEQEGTEGHLRMPQQLQRQQQERESQQEQQQLLLQAVRDIHEAEFVAVDLEFTGLLLGPPSPPISLQSYFEKCHKAAKAFLAPQIGICCARRDEENSTRWLLHPYTFDAHPRRGRSIFSIDLKSMRFLHKNGFDFNRWLENGQLELLVHSLDYERLCEVQQQQQESLEALQQRLQQKGGKIRSSNSSSDDGVAVTGCGSWISHSAAGRGPATSEREEALPAGSKQLLEGVADVAGEPHGLANTKAEARSTSDKSSDDVGGLSVLAGALIEAGAPLVFHNGLLDLLHILEKFVEEVPPTVEAFAAEVCRLFIGGVFDTKYIATHLTPGSVFGRTALQALRNHLLASPGLPCCFDIAESCKRRFNFSFKELNVANELPEARSHEAGFDALATAQASELQKAQRRHELWHADMPACMQPLGHRRALFKRITLWPAQVFVCLAAAAAKQQEQDVCLSLLREGRDVIGVAGVKPGYVKLRSFLPEKTIPLRSASSDSRVGSSNDKEAGDKENGCSGRDATQPKTNKRDRHCRSSPLCAVPDAAAAAAPASGEPAEPSVARAPRRMRLTP
ncbi:hypothetical protein Esti_003058 [Eimeria stiedai]